MIGCVLLVEPLFWPEELWIPDPVGWHPNIQRGRTYDLSAGDGQALWAMVVERLYATPRSAEAVRDAPPEPTGGYGDPLLQPRRLGQGTFRALVTDTYERRCAVTQERALPALDAAHILPFHQVRAHSVRNGILLRSDVHRLFDAGYITITPAHRVEASLRMRDDFDDGENYLRLHGTHVRVPEREEARPDPEALRRHNEEVFRG